MKVPMTCTDPSKICRIAFNAMYNFFVMRSKRKRISALAKKRENSRNSRRWNNRLQLTKTNHAQPMSPRKFRTLQFPRILKSRQRQPILAGLQKLARIEIYLTPTKMRNMGKD